MSDDNRFLRAEIVAYLATDAGAELDDIACHVDERLTDTRRALNRLIGEGVVTTKLQVGPCDSCGTAGKIKTETFALNPEEQWAS